MTVEHLLAHRSGIGDYLDEETDSAEDYPMPVSVHRLATTEDFLPVLDGYPTKFPRVAGAGYHELVEELVCRPAGMSDSAFLRSDDLPGRAAVGYVEIDGHWRTNVFHLPVRGTGDGGLYTTVADQHRFWAALFAHKIITAPTLDRMLQPSPTSDQEGEPRYGLGFWRPAGGDRVMLVGMDAGVSYRSVHDPAAGATYTVIANTSNGAWPTSRCLDAILNEPDG
ncbi:serine hydrolase domain-containing protein [Microlunatus speluncae]|uniref:serine hydrolase domain-containing protein n=1 Tax=Microlunatus speluncae TaxID=2594267 RepID=UPI001C2D4D7B|nr:serine hydrolase domain-containing protein [Microlunatus speluncae]